MSSDDIKVTSVQAFDDDQLVVGGYKDGGDGKDPIPLTAIGHVSWTTNYFADPAKPEKRRKMTKQELRDYCEQLLRESAAGTTSGQVDLHVEPVLDPEPEPEPAA